MNLLIATTNPGKIKEFREMLGGTNTAFDDLAAHRDVPAPDETGHTFRANACLKAAYYARALNTYAVADDSGLEVDALDGAPGVYSARWAEMNHVGHGDADNNALLLKQIDAVPDERRTGRFVCVLALADPSGKILLTARDTVEGHVLRAGRGTNGFGYDPLFAPDQTPGKTTAELLPAEKHAISHRGKALRTLRELMRQVGF
ncbi:MAG: RdgB/HAM1 family non-canonical purine NTP pyrophosphatase [Phycisphaerae bacterium]|nr:RdgB/HAM1 family non-canonical purine NTP pyrophosphatase [Tepidisphaeraceae bacterium]